MLHRTIFSACCFSLLLACSSEGSDGAGPPGSGGSNSSGGQTGSGGASAGTSSAGNAGTSATGGSAGTTSSGGASGSGGSQSCGGTITSGGQPVTGTPGTWEPMLQYPKDTQPISGDGLVSDPVNPGTLYAFYEEYQPNGQPRHVLKTTDYGTSWEQVDVTPVVGNPWGVAIDPNPCRNPSTPPTMYTPAGYGDGGVWKSTDGGANWVNLFADHSDGVVPKTGGGTTTFPPDKNGAHVDFYEIFILPDDPPNHILITYHYQADGQPAPLGESKDGGQSWEVHLLPAGNSHYAYGFDASNWLVISGEGSGGGIYRTTTAGRVSGEISQDAWVKVDDLEHQHGSFTPYYDKMGDFLYFPGKAGIRRTSDSGATWSSVYDNSMSVVLGTDTTLYAFAFGYGGLMSSPRDDAMTWTDLVPPTNEAWGGGTPPIGAASVFDGEHWVLLKAEYGHCSNNCQPARSPLIANGEVWRYIEP